jgi:hypothetical protein
VESLPVLHAGDGRDRAASATLILVGRVPRMLKFEPDFVADQDNLSCVLYADAPSGERVSFIIDRLILQGVLGGGDDAGLALCLVERARIEAARTRAFTAGRAH